MFIVYQLRRPNNTDDYPTWAPQMDVFDCAYVVVPPSVDPPLRLHGWNFNRVWLTRLFEVETLGSVLEMQPTGLVCTENTTYLRLGGTTVCTACCVDSLTGGAALTALNITKERAASC